MCIYTDRERLEAALKVIAGIYTPEDLDIVGVTDPAMKLKAITVVLEIYDKPTAP